jgi:hypothetical protein
MKSKTSLIIVGLVFLSLAVNAQKINTDSLNHVSKIAEYQLKKAKLQNMVDKTTQDKQDAAIKVQNSANQNSTDATRLSNDPQNKQLAKNADNSASDARRDSKRSRIANDKLVDLNKQIAKLTNQIAEEQTKLDAYRTPVTTTAVPSAIPAVADTTHPS